MFSKTPIVQLNVTGNIDQMIKHGQSLPTVWSRLNPAAPSAAPASNLIDTPASVLLIKLASPSRFRFDFQHLVIFCAKEAPNHSCADERDLRLSTLTRRRESDLPPGQKADCCSLRSQEIIFLIFTEHLIFPPPTITHLQHLQAPGLGLQTPKPDRPRHRGRCLDQVRLPHQVSASGTHLFDSLTPSQLGFPHRVAFWRVWCRFSLLFSHKSLGSPVTLHSSRSFPNPRLLRESSSFLLVSRQVLSIFAPRSSTSSTLTFYQRRQEGTRRVNHKNRHRDCHHHHGASAGCSIQPVVSPLVECGRRLIQT